MDRKKPIVRKHKRPIKKTQAKVKYLEMHTWVNKIIFKCGEVINIEVGIMVTLLSIIT